MSIVSKPLSRAGRDNWEDIFGKERGSGDVAVAAEARCRPEDFGFDADSYPTDAMLKAIEAWPPVAGFAGLLAAIQPYWRYPDYWEQEGRNYSISTGGWSGNEDIIGALQANHMFWACCWYSSRRGGHYEFRLAHHENAAPGGEVKGE